ncbi:MAG: peptidylprolyl isomerase [Prevotella sp.]|nr:peptidylprolyl isomerase [Prevotella sp.]
MRIKTILAMLAIGTLAFAQNDPTIMTINGVPVSRSEFEYSYNKNNSEGVIDKKTVDEYVDLFINYKLKVAAAIDARLDTMTSFKKEFAQYRDQQVRPSFITDTDVEKEAKNIYDQTQHYVDSLGGLINPSHILVKVSQKATGEEQRVAREKADSIYNAIVGGADFGDLARKCSDDKGSAVNGGELNWIQPGQTVQEFEKAAYALNKGEMSRPVLSPFGYHIIKMNDRKMFVPYDSVKADIITFIDRRGIRERIIDQKIEEIVASENNTLTKEQLLEQKADELSANDSDLANLIREYHDGLLLYEISNREVWEKGSKDEAGLANYFKKNKKKYTWDSPRFKGIAYHVKDQADVKAVKNSVKGLAFDKWAEKLRTTFNGDSVIRIRVEKGIFKEGDNKLVDKEVFKKDVEVTPTKDYPIDAVYGKVLKAPKEYTDVRGQVTADYQDKLEKEWVEQLRKRYTFTVNKDVLATVNKH